MHHQLLFPLLCLFLVAAQPLAPLNLTSGTPTSLSLPRNGHLFFVYPITPYSPLTGLPGILLLLTPTSGSCDMFVTAGKFYTPEPGNSEWSTIRSHGTQIISIPPNATFTDVGRQCARQSVCSINVGVYAPLRDCNATLWLSDFSSSNPLELIPDVPVAGVVEGGVPGGGGTPLSTFSLSLPPTLPLPASLTVRLTQDQIEGDASSSTSPISLLVSTNGIFSPPCASSTQPVGVLSSLTLTLHLGDLCYPQTTTSTSNLTFAVSGGALGQLFSLLLTTSAQPYATLLEGVPQDGGGVEGMGEGFYSSLGSSTSSAGVRLTIFPASGTVQAFVLLVGGGATQTSPPPLPGTTPGSYTFTLSSNPLLPFSPIALTLLPSDPLWANSTCGGGNSTTPCSLYLSVFTSSAHSSYTVTAGGSSGGVWEELAQGAPITDSAGAGQVRGYEIYTPTTPPSTPTNALLVSLAIISSQSGVVVGVSCWNSTPPTSTTPNPTDFPPQNPANKDNASQSWLWVNAGDGGVERMVEVYLDPATTPGFCPPPSLYTIGIASSSANDAEPLLFSLLVKSVSGGSGGGQPPPTPLTLGFPVGDTLILPRSPLSTFSLLGDYVPATMPTLTLALFLPQGYDPTLPMTLSAAASPTAPPLTPFNQTSLWVAPPPLEGQGSWLSITISNTDPLLVASGCTGGGVCYITIGVGCVPVTPQPPLTPLTFIPFTLSASVSQRVLTDSTPVVDTVGVYPGENSYVFFALDAVTPITVSLVPIGGTGGGGGGGGGGGQPPSSPVQLVGTVGFAPNASNTGSQWGSRREGSEYFTVTWREPWVVTGALPTFPCPLFISVIGSPGGGSEHYTLTATTSPYPTLIPGDPSLAVTKGGVLSYLLFTPPAPSTPSATSGNNATQQGFTVSLEDSTSGGGGGGGGGGIGEVTFWVNVVGYSTSGGGGSGGGGVPPYCAHCGFPTCTSPTFPCDPTHMINTYTPWVASTPSLSTTGGGRLMVVVQAHDPFYCSTCTYVVAVLTRVDTDTLTLTASLTQAVLPLVEGVPTLWAIDDSGGTSGTYAWFYLLVTNIEVSVSVTLTPLILASPTTIVDLYASTSSSNTHPWEGNYTAKASGGGGGATPLTLTFPWSSLPECPDSSVAEAIYCHVFFAVRCSDSGSGSASSSSGGVSTFSILASAENVNATPTRLYLDAPQFGVVRASDSVQYYAPLDLPPGTPYYLTLNPHGVAKVYLYATTDGSRPSPNNPTAVTTGGEGGGGSNGPRSIVFTPGSPAYNNTALLKVSVDCPFIPQGGAVGFDVTLTLGSSLTLLAEGVPFQAETQVGYTRYFYFPVGETGGVLDLTLSTLSSPPPASRSPVLFVGVAPPQFNGGPINASFIPGPASHCTLSPGGGAAWRVELPTSPGSGSDCACPPPPTPCQYIFALSCPGIPFTQPTCQNTLTVAWKSAPGTPPLIMMEPGVPFSSPVLPLPLPSTTTTTAAATSTTTLSYFYLDVASLWNDNLTVGVWLLGGGEKDGPLTLRATLGNSWSPPPPPLDTSSSSSSSGGAVGTPWVWDSNSFDPPSPTAAHITVSPSDPPFFACPTCTLLCISLSQGSSSAGGGGGSSDGVYTLLSATPSGSPSVLRLGESSPTSTVGYRTIQRFTVWLLDAGADLEVSVTALSGTLAFTVDAGSAPPSSPPPTCTISRPGNAINCTGTWFRGSAGSLIVSASSPCANANPGATSPCMTPRDWGVGHLPAPYTITVLATISPTAFTVTASQRGVVVQLTPGTPITSSASNPSNPSAFVVFATTSSRGGSGGGMNFIVSSTDVVPLDWVFYASPKGGGGGLPPPTSSSDPRVTASGHIASFSTLSFTATPGSVNWCASGGGGEVGCYLYMTLLPPPPPLCPPLTCSASATVVAQVIGGGGGESPTDIPASMVDQRTASALFYYSSSSSSQSTNPTPITVFLPPASSSSPSSSSSTLSFHITLESCGPTNSNTPSLYLCDPSAPVGRGRCTPYPFTPSPSTGFTGSITTTAQTGVGTLLLPTTSASNLYLAVFPPTGYQSKPAGGDFMLRLRAWGGSGSSLPPNLLLPPLLPPTTTTSSVFAPTSTTAQGSPQSITLLWTPPSLSNGTTPRGLIYTLYLFVTAPSTTTPSVSSPYYPGGGVIDTLCGLDNLVADGGYGVFKAGVVEEGGGGGKATITLPSGLLAPLPQEDATGVLLHAVLTAQCDEGCGGTGVALEPLGAVFTEVTIAVVGSGSGDVMGGGGKVGARVILALLGIFVCCGVLLGGWWWYKGGQVPFAAWLTPASAPGAGYVRVPEREDEAQMRARVEQLQQSRLEDA